MFEVALFIVEFPDACALAFGEVALVEGDAVLVVDDVGAVFLAVDKGGFDLDIAVGEVEEDAAVALACGEAFGATHGIVAVELNDILVGAGTEDHGGGGAEETHVADTDRVEFAVVVGAAVAVEELPVGAEFVVAGEIAAGKELAVVEIVLPYAVGLFGHSGEGFLELQLAVLIVHTFPNADG